MDFLSKNVSRRTLLKGGALLGTGAMMGFNHVFGYSRVFGQAAADDDLQTIINLAATAELFATTHYLAAINGAGDLGLAEKQVDYLKAGFLAEQDHLELLQSLGAVPVVTEFYVPENLFSDKALFAAVTEVAETAFVGAYLAATRVFSKSADTTPYAVTTAQIAAVEAEHRALARQIGEKLPNNISYAQYTLNNVSDAVPVLQPFLDGQPADNSLGAFVGPVQPPTADDIAGIREEIEALGYDNTVQPFAAM
ncbi:MAG: ferritin-like domain-containing protein [Chloroflexi bacterium]|nr:ferritin-like domain-containing protein [Chloroflexota bacterium]MCC6894805.1 ferritin-like domain-containing protein [Anaerolineae bacterium]